MKKRLLAILMTLCMIITLLPVTALADGDIVEMSINGGAAKRYAASEVEGFFSDLQAATTADVKMLSSFAIGERHIPIKEGQTVSLDFNGCTLSKADNSTYAPIENYGTMTLLDTSEAKNGGIAGENRCVNNYGTMTIDGGKYSTSNTLGGTAIQNKAETAIMTINDCVVTAGVFAFYNAGTATINGGKFENYGSCSSCNPNGWAYTAKSVGTLYVNGGEIHGVQGALGISAGYAEIRGGTFYAHACELHGHQGEGSNNAFYGLYVAGEEDEVKCVVYDGNIISEGKYAAALIGNDNTNGDGGINADATSEIKGGTFTATLASTPALKGAPNTGNPIITGGTFSSDVSEYVADTASIGKDSNSGKWVVSSLTAETGVAETGGNYYSTLAAAVAAAGEGETVTLLKDVTLTEDVNFTHSVKLVMNGYDISIPSTLTKTLWVCNGVTLTIEGDDTSVITGSIGFPANVASGHLILNGGTYTANLSNDAMIYVNGTIQGGNRVMIDISDATLNSTDDTFYLAGNSITSVTDSTINGYTGIYMKAGTVNLENTIINAVGAYAEPVPNGNGASSTGDGIIMDSKQGYNGNMILNLGQGVKITSKNAYAVREALTDLSESSTVSVSITDGAYAGASDKAALVFSGAFNTAVGSGQATRSITGGYFTSDPSAYISDTGLDAIPGSYVVDGVTYSYKVGEALPDNVTIAAGDTEVNNPNNVDTAVVEKIAEATATGTSDSANEAAASLNESDKATAEKFNAAAGELAEGIPTASGEVATVVAPRLDITVMGYNAAENTLTLDIKAVYDIKATTDAGNMVELNDDKSNATSVNTVTLEKNAGTLDTSGTEVEITIPLPTDFVNSTSDPVFITHVKDNGVKYVYKATVASDGASGFTATFTNPHGFSSFTLTTETAASITDNGVTTYYDTLQEAVDAVANGQTIKLERDVTESPVVAKTVNFTLDLNSKSFTGSITAGANTTAAAGNPAANTGGDFSFTYTAPSGGATTYSITVEKAEHGTVTSSHRNASRGVTVTLTVKADEGYELDGLSVTDANGSELKLTDKGNGKYTFTMPGAKVTVKAAFKAAEHVCPAEKFPDVDTGAWYHEAVDYVLEKGMMQGSGSRFMPAESLSRGMLVQVLYNLEGKPAVSGSAFEDVSAQAWYADAVAWASANQVVGGYGNGKFGPEDSITREQMAAILYRYAKVKGYDTTQGGMAVREFADYEQISDWAGEAMAWAVNAKVLSGKGNHTLDPKGTASRAEVAQVLMNFGENVSK